MHTRRINLPGRQIWLVCLLLVFATLLVYQPVWHAGFIWDDDELLTNNPVVKSAHGLSRAWFTTSTLDYYPMTFTLWWLEWRMWGDNPLGYHLVNVLLHAVSTMLLWRVLLRLKIPGALLAAALFALHPVNVESVAWISEGKNTLSMVFFLSALLFWLKYEDSGRARWYGLALAAFALALFGKTAAAPLPMVLLGLSWWRRGRLGWKDARQVVPFFALAAAVCWVTVWFHFHRAMGDEVVRTDGFMSRLAGAGWAVWFYLYKALLPLNLIFVYPRWHIDPQNLLTYIPLVLLAAAFILFWRVGRPWGKASFFGLAYFVVMLLPVLGFLNIYYMRYSLVADHWQYFALIGPIVLASVILVRIPVLAVAVLVVLGGLTWKQNRIYVDAETLWRTTLARNPASTIAPNNLSRALLDKGQPDEALLLCQSVVASHPDDATAQFNLADALLQKDRPNEAIVHFQKAQALRPAMSGIPYHIGQAYLKKGEWDAAIRSFQQAIQLQPKYTESVLQSWLCPVARGAAARGHVRATTRRSNWTLVTRSPITTLEMSFFTSGERIRPWTTFGRLRKSPPELPRPTSIWRKFSSRGRLDDAISQYQKALAIRPDLAEARYKLGNIFAQKGRDAKPLLNSTLPCNFSRAWPKPATTWPGFSRPAGTLPCATASGLCNWRSAPASLRRGKTRSSWEHWRRRMRPRDNSKKPSRRLTGRCHWRETIQRWPARWKVNNRSSKGRCWTGRRPNVRMGLPRLVL